MRTAPLLLVLLLGSCGGRTETFSQGPGSSTTAPGPTSGPPGGAVPTSTSSPGDPGPPTKAPPPDSQFYTAYVWAGGLDHLEIYKADYASNTCTSVSLTSPETSSGRLGITAPAGWAVSHATRDKGASSCGPNGSRSGSAARTGKGVITWVEVPGQIYPCKLDVLAVLLFDGKQEAEPLEANGIPVNGCN
jgi:hypothetical protein